VTSVFDPSNTAAPSNDRNADGGNRLRFETYKAALPVGKGAVPLPDIPDTTLKPSYNADPEEAQDASPLALPWTTFYLGDEACDTRLPESAPRDHQVIVLRRGGCSFSAKLANIPSYTPASQSLQLVVIVDDEPLTDPDLQDDDDLTDDERDHMVYGAHLARQPWDLAADMVKPHLDEEQRTPGGIPRHRPVSMLMIRGGTHRYPGGAYAQFARASGAGVRRKYFIETQGRRVDNIIIL